MPQTKIKNLSLASRDIHCVLILKISNSRARSVLAIRSSWYVILPLDAGRRYRRSGRVTDAKDAEPIVDMDFWHFYARISRVIRINKAEC